MWVTSYEIRNSFYELQSNFTSCKFILPVASKIKSFKLPFAICELLFTSCKVILQVANLFCKLQIKLQVLQIKLHFESCELLFTSYKLTETKLRALSCVLCIANLKDSKGETKVE